MKGLMTKDFLTVKKKYGLTRLIMDFGGCWRNLHQFPVGAVGSSFYADYFGKF